MIEYTSEIDDSIELVEPYPLCDARDGEFAKAVSMTAGCDGARDRGAASYSADISDVTGDGERISRLPSEELREWDAIEYAGSRFVAGVGSGSSKTSWSASGPAGVGGM